MQKFRKVFRGLPDPRAANAFHDLLDIIVIALAATLCGANGATDMALFARSKEGLLRQFLPLEHGLPSHDTFSRVLRALDPEAFDKAFRRFTAAFAKANGIKLTGVIAIDGKALRGAYERGKSSTPLHMVNVFAAEARMALASRKAPGRNEAKGALEVLRMLSLEGCIVTGDALHCNRPFVEMVLKRGGHYAVALKKNQGKLFDAVARALPAPASAASPNIWSRPLTTATNPGVLLSFATPARPPRTAFRGSLPWLASPRADASTGGAPTSRPYATTCFPSISPPSGCCRLCAVIGPSRTGCIGYSTSCSTRMATEPERTMVRRTSRSCEDSHSTSFARIPTAYPCAKKSNALAGTMPSCSISSATCDSPALAGRDRHRR